MVEDLGPLRIAKMSQFANFFRWLAEWQTGRQAFGAALSCSWFAPLIRHFPTTMTSKKGYSAALAIPCLPPSHPAAPSPPSMALPLHPHQQRALHRCLLIEQDGSLSTGFNALPGKFAEYKSRGGVLADAVGTGKTATIIALVLAGKGGGGATLVVAPSHLVPQWKAEVAKFAPAIEVCVGEAEHLAAGPVRPKKRRIVLVPIGDILSSPKVRYSYVLVYDVLVYVLMLCVGFGISCRQSNTCTN